MLNRPLHVLALAALAAFATLSTDATAQVAPTPLYVFDTVDAYSFSSGTSVYVTGVQHGANASSSIFVYLGNVALQSVCEHDLLVMMNRPGRFSFGVSNQICTLTRLP